MRAFTVIRIPRESWDDLLRCAPVADDVELLVDVYDDSDEKTIAIRDDARHWSPPFRCGLESGVDA